MSQNDLEQRCVMETNLIFEGLKFMVLGMGTVFVFLVILIALMNAMSYVVHKYFPEVQPTENKPSAQDNKKVVAAITAAIMHHRNGA